MALSELLFRSKFPCSWDPKHPIPTGLGVQKIILKMSLSHLTLVAMQRVSLAAWPLPLMVPSRGEIFVEVCQSKDSFEYEGIDKTQMVN